MLLFTIVCFVESPKFLYNKKRYEEARRSLSWVAYYNGVTNYDTNFVFDKEQTELALPDAEQQAAVELDNTVQTEAMEVQTL